LSIPPCAHLIYPSPFSISSLLTSHIYPCRWYISWRLQQMSQRWEKM
jgi:hypothetical protein